MNKPCSNDSLCLHEYSKIIGLKRATFARSGKVEMISTFKRNRHFRKVLVNKTFTHVQVQKKAMSLRHSAYIPSSVKSPLYVFSFAKKCRDFTYSIS